MMGAVIAIALKDLKLLVRDKTAAFFTLLFPLLISMFFGFIFAGMYGGGGAGKMEIAVANLDGGPASVAFLKDLKEDGALEVREVATREAGESLVRRRDVAAVVTVPKGFEENSGGIFAGRTMKIEAVVDPSRGAESGLLTGKLNEIAYRQMQRVFTDPAAMSRSLDQATERIGQAPDLTDEQKDLFTEMFGSIRRLNDNVTLPDEDGDEETPAMAGWQPIEVDVSELQSKRRTPASSYAVSFPQGVVWGLMGCVMAFVMSLASERTTGTLMRLTTAPIPRWSIQGGKALACFSLAVLMQAALMALAIVVFGVKVDQPLMLAAVIVASAVAFTGLMVLFASMARTERAASGMGQAVIMILAMIGGGTVPLFFLPPIVQTVSRISPFSWTTMGFEGAIWRGLTPGQIAVPVAVLLGFGVAGFLGGVIVFRRSGERFA